MVVVKKIKRLVIVKRKGATPAPPPSPRPASPGTAAPSARRIKEAYKAGTVRDLELATRKERLLQLISENFGKSKPLTMYQMMLNAGYAESTAKQQSAVLMTIKEGAEEGDPTVTSHLERLKKIREKMLARLEDQVQYAKYGSLAYGLTVLDKSIALMEGKPTERIAHELPEEERLELLEILEMNE